MAPRSSRSSRFSCCWCGKMHKADNKHSRRVAARTGFHMYSRFPSILRPVKQHNHNSLSFIALCSQLFPCIWSTCTLTSPPAPPTSEVGKTEKPKWRNSLTAHWSVSRQSSEVGGATEWIFRKRRRGKRRGKRRGDAQCEGGNGEEIPQFALNAAGGWMCFESE